MNIPIGEVCSGMVLARELKSGDNVLLREGAVLTDAIIKTLKTRRVLFADITPESAEMYSSSFSRSNSDNLFENQEYVEKRNRIKEMFATVSKDDEQMPVLEYCILRQLEEEYRG